MFFFYLLLNIKFWVVNIINILYFYFVKYCVYLFSIKNFIQYLKYLFIKEKIYSISFFYYNYALSYYGDYEEESIYDLDSFIELELILNRGQYDHLFCYVPYYNMYWKLLSFINNDNDNSKSKSILKDNYPLYYFCDTFLKYTGKKNDYIHLFHLVSFSPWPLFMGISIFFLALGVSLGLHRFDISSIFLVFSFFHVIFVMVCWFQDILEEGIFQGKHTSFVQKGLKWGIYLFITSEVMFFFSFFWALFHSGIVPVIELGTVWPPLEIIPLNAFSVPLANTLTLIYSGISVTYAHHSLVLIKYPFSVTNKYIPVFNNNNLSFDEGLRITLLAAVWFLFLQYCEYKEACFDITDSVFGSTFFITTGFHGFHVTVGFIWLFFCWLRIPVKNRSNRWYSLKRKQHIGLEGGIWYWHFVDVVWIGLYFCVYIWGGSFIVEDSTTYMPKLINYNDLENNDNNFNRIFTNSNIPAGIYSDYDSFPIEFFSRLIYLFK